MRRIRGKEIMQILESHASNRRQRLGAAVVPSTDCGARVIAAWVEPIVYCRILVRNHCAELAVRIDVSGMTVDTALTVNELNRIKQGIVELDVPVWSHLRQLR